MRYSPFAPSPPHGDPTSPAYLASQPPAFFRGRSPSAILGQDGSPEIDYSTTKGQNPSAVRPPPVVPISPTTRARRASAAEKVLEQLRNRSDLQKPMAFVVGSPRTAWGHYHESITTPTFPTAAISQDGHGSRRPGSRRQSLITPIGPPPSPVVPKVCLPTSNPTGIRSRLSWNQHAPQQVVSGLRPYPPNFLALLDGEHHTDELAVRFEAGWPLIEQWLVHAGGGAGDGDFGKVCIIYQ